MSGILLLASGLLLLGAVVLLIAVRRELRRDIERIMRRKR